MIFIFFSFSFFEGVFQLRLEGIYTDFWLMKILYILHVCPSGGFWLMYGEGKKKWRDLSQWSLVFFLKMTPEPAATNVFWRTKRKRVAIVWIVVGGTSDYMYIPFSLLRHAIFFFIFREREIEFGICLQSNMIVILLTYIFHNWVWELGLGSMRKLI